VVEKDLTIVNPGKLPPALRDAVCQQCHLQGEARVVRRGRRLQDYRPGLPLHEFLAIFVKPPGQGDHSKSVSQVEQLQESLCFQKSKGKMGCITCHDPHQLPAPAARVAYYRNRCLTCHQTTSCSVAPADRKRRQPDDSCVACHMASNRSANIVHAAVTDHRILREPSAPASPKPIKRPIQAREVDFYRALRSKTDPDLARDRALAVTILAASARSAWEQKVMSMEALFDLNRAVRAHPEDLEAQVARANCYGVLDLPAKALRTNEFVLARVPDNENALRQAMTTATARNETDKALRYGSQLLKLNPTFPDYHGAMSALLAKKRQWREAIAESKEALRLNPDSVPARATLILCEAKTGHKDRAKAQMKVLLRLNPPQRESLESWFNELMNE
jgi:predicted CXXCH cytochrome family protein